MMSALFICTTLLSFVLFFEGTGRDKRVLVFFSLWIFTTGALSFSGFFKDTLAMPPRFLLVLIPATFFVIYFYKSIPVTKLKVHYLLGVHAQRVPVELFLYQLFLEKKVPQLMTFKGWNLDILSGISAIMFLIYMLTSRKEPKKTLMKCWNIAGLILLGIIVLTAILSAPLPLQLLAFDQPNVAVLAFPYTYLPAVIVPLVLLSHLLTLKKIRSSQAR